jgi:Helix-turn-helix domain/Bacterial regulatory proteins, gntR family
MPPETAPPVEKIKYMQVAARVRNQIADGTLLPGEPAPSGAALSRMTGYSVLTCRKALRVLIKDGVLAPGPSRSSRPRVSSRPTPGEEAFSGAARRLSASLAALRRAACLTQPQLAEVIGVSVTTVGHAETGRLWQARRFWENADRALSADGELLSLHNAFRAAATQETEPESGSSEGIPVALENRTVTINVPSCPVACVTITWANGAVTAVYPPQSRGGGDFGLSKSH